MKKQNQALLGEFARVRSIFDLFAVVAAYLLTLNRRSSDYSEEDLEEFGNDMLYPIELFFDRMEGIADSERLKRLCHDVTAALKPYVDDDDIFALLCMSLVREIDGNLVLSEWRGGFARCSGCTDYFEFDFLNQNYRDKVGILPIEKNTFVERISKKYEAQNGQPLFRDKKDAEDLCITDLVTHFLIFDQRKAPLPSCHTCYFPKCYGTGKHFAQLQQLKIGIAPMLYHNIEEILDIRLKDSPFPEGKGQFEILGYQSKPMLLQKYLAAVREAQRQKVDFLIFPEMLIAPEFLEEAACLEGKLPIMINGSFWEERKNYCHISDVSSRILATYYKREAFDYKKDGKIYREHLDVDLSNRQKQFILLDFEGFARVSLCICRDLDYARQRDFHKHIQADILFVPAFSDSKDMRRAAMELAGNHKMLVVMANTCAAVWNKKNSLEDCCKRRQMIGFIAAPGKQGTKRGSLLHNYCMGSADCGQCKNATMSCCNLVTVNLKEYAIEGNICTIGIQQSFPVRQESDFGKESDVV